MSDFLDAWTRAGKLLRAVADNGMRKHGLHLGQNLVLAALWKRDGQTPGELATALNVTTPTVVKMATRMSTAGLLTRRRDDRDNRLVRLWLTDEGRALQGPVEAERKAMAEQVLEGLTKAQRAELIRTLTVLADNAARLHEGPLEPHVD